MQLSKSYESTNKAVRAQQHRKSAVECENAGFPEIAKYNWQMAGLLEAELDLEESEERTYSY